MKTGKIEMIVLGYFLNNNKNNVFGIIQMFPLQKIAKEQQIEKLQHTVVVWHLQNLKKNISFKISMLYQY